MPWKKIEARCAGEVLKRKQQQSKAGQNMRGLLVAGGGPEELVRRRAANARALPEGTCTTDRTEQSRVASSRCGAWLGLAWLGLACW